MMTSMKSSAWLALVLTGALTACGDKPPPAPMVDGGGGVMDASTPDDAGPTPDGGDAGSGDVDGAVTMTDGGGEEGTCTFDIGEDRFGLASDLEARGRLVRVAGGANSWGVVWADMADGFRDVRGAVIPTSGGPTPAVVDVTDDPSTELEPAVAYAGGSWLVSYASNAGGTYDVYVRAASGALAPTGTASQLTTTADREDSTSIVPAGDGYLVSWVQDDMLAGTRQIFVQALGSDFAAVGSPQMAAVGSAGTTVPELASVGSGAALLFARGTAGGGEIVLQMLDADGTPQGTPTVVADSGIEGTVDIAGGAEGGAVVYGLIVGGSRTEVRFRAYDMDGALTGGTRVVAGSPDEGRDASITPFAGGYAAAYRRIDSPTEATLVLALMNIAGEVVDQLDLMPVTPSGGRTSIEASGDGNLLVGLAMPADSKTDIVAARVRCN